MLNKKILVPMVMLATLSTITSCTKPTTSNPVQSPTQSQQDTNKIEAVKPNGVNTDTTSAPIVLTRKEIVSYDSKTPEGMVQVEFDVTVTDGIITAASATSKTDKQGSNYNQTNFTKGLSTVVGKKAKDLDVDAIGGASLTTAAFEAFVHGF